MKKIMKLIWAVVAMFASVQLMALDNTFNVNVVGEKKLRVDVSEIKGEGTSYIQDSFGQILYKRDIKEGSSLNILFDLALVNPGSYKIVLEDEVKSQSVPFTISANGIVVNMEDHKKVFFPTLTYSDETVMVKLISNDENPLYINIESEDGDVLFTEKIDGQTGLIGKKFIFKPGDYSITLSSEAYVKTSFLSIK